MQASVKKIRQKRTGFSVRFLRFHRGRTDTHTAFQLNNRQNKCLVLLRRCECGVNGVRRIENAAASVLPRQWFCVFPFKKHWSEDSDVGRSDWHGRKCAIFGDQIDGAAAPMGCDSHCLSQQFPPVLRG